MKTKIDLEHGLKEPKERVQGGVRHRQSVEARKVLVEATIRCLDKWGYSATSIARIQNEAKVSRGALTHHFPSKEDLMVSTIDNLLENLLRPSLPSKKLSRSDITADLRWLARGGGHRALADAAAHRVGDCHARVRLEKCVAGEAPSAVAGARGLGRGLPADGLAM